MRHNLMRGRCPLCGRELRYANLPNLGPRMVHASGDGEACRQLVALGNDLPSREARMAREKAEREARLAAFRKELKS